MRRKAKAWGVALLALLVLAAVGVGLIARYEDRLLPALGLGRPVVLYFARPDGMALATEVRYTLPGLDGPMQRLQMLAEGPRPESGLAPVLPPGTRPLGVHVDDGVATVDFSREIIERHWGGSTAELLTVYGIVNTLTAAPGIQRVQIRVEGRPIETLAGHVDLSQPLPADPSLVVAIPSDSGPSAAP
ncbi:MAG TPA: GerMN domain-containing protein [Limnochordales bacterium]